MNIEQAQRVYVEAAIKHGLGTDESKSRVANRAHDRVLRAVKVLRGSPDRGAAFLLDLLSHENSHVRCCAATHLLPLNESAALAALEQISKLPPGSGLARIIASTVIQEWRTGSLRQYLESI